MAIWRFATLGALGVVLCATIARAHDPEETFGCEANPTGDPVGGGSGYRDIHATGDFIVKTKAELLSALKEGKAGQVVVDAHVGAPVIVKRYDTLPSGRRLAKHADEPAVPLAAAGNAVLSALHPNFVPRQPRLDSTEEVGIPDDELVLGYE